MKSRLYKILTILTVISLVGACKLTVHNGDGGNVQSLTGTRECTEGRSCVFEITDANFNESFTAVPRMGFEFIKWQAGDGFLCGDSHNPTCTVSTIGLGGDPVAMGVITSDRVVRISPIFDRARDPALVVVDANNKFIGVTLDLGNVFVSFDGFSGAYRMSIDSTTKRLRPEAATLFTDSSCGMDGGEPYLDLSDTGNSHLLLDVGGGVDGKYYVPSEGASTELVTWNSISYGEGNECYVDGRNNQKNLVPAAPVELEVAYPIRLTLR